MRQYHIALFLLAYVSAFAISAWAGYYFYADYALHKVHHKEAETQRFQSDMAYVDLPRISVTLSSANGHAGTVRMDVTLEVENKYVAQVQGFRPRIADRLIRYAQTLNYDDLAAAKSIVWLKPDMLQEIQDSGTPAPIRDIIFREFIVL